MSGCGLRDGQDSDQDSEACFEEEEEGDERSEDKSCRKRREAAKKRLLRDAVCGLVAADARKSCACGP